MIPTGRRFRRAACGRRARRTRARAAPGFTLIELMVAIGLSAVVAVGLYSLSMVASQTFQQQQRISEIQLRLRSAMELLRADLQRAGYMATPASAADAWVCPKPATPIQAVWLRAETTNPTHLPASNTGIDPVRLYVTGNFASTDEYRIMYVQGNTLCLQQHTLEYLRIPNEATFNRIFARNRVVRLRGTDGRMQFTKVSSGTYAAATGAACPTLTLADTPLIVGTSSGGTTAGCGLTGLGVGATVAPVTTVEYRIGRAEGQDLAYQDSAPFSTGKTDLLRTEMRPDATGLTALAETTRIVAEYAVDFDVAAVVDNAAAGIANEPVLRRYAFGDAQNFTELGQSGGGTARPQRLRGLQIRLSVRDRTQDPEFGWVARPAGAPLTRFRVFGAQSGAARVRTLTTEIMLPNVSARNLR